MSNVITNDSAPIEGNRTAGGVSTATAAPLAAISLTAARLSLAAASLFLVLLAALHFIKPEFDPSWRLISEYGIGVNGWIMSFAFLSLALSCVTLFLGVRSQVRTTGGRIGLVLLLVSALGLTMGGIFTTDPITATSEELTTTGSLHGVGFFLGIPTIVLASALISWSLTRNPDWSTAKRSIAWAAVLVWVGLVVFGLTIAITLPGSNGFGPDVPVGWPNRFLIVTQCAWLMVVAWNAIKLRDQES